MSQSRQLVAIMFADIVGYTALMQRNEQDALRIVERFKQVQNQLTKEYAGDTLKYFGDGSMTVFRSVLDAINCALKLQLELQKSPKVSLRIGIHTGDVLFKDGEVYGDGINVASRLQTFGEPGSIIFSGDVYDKVKNQSGLNSKYLGQHQFKNVLSLTAVFALDNPYLTVPEIAEDQKKSRKPIRMPILIALLALVVVGFVTTKLLNNENSRTENEELLLRLTKEFSSFNDYSEGIRNWEIYNGLMSMKSRMQRNIDYNLLWDAITFKLHIETNVKGASVYAKPYSNPDTTWHYLGKTPLYSYPFPKGLSRIKIEYENYNTQLDMIFRPFNKDFPTDTLVYSLFEPDEVPAGMVYTTDIEGDYWTTPQLPSEKIPAFWVDQFEVTNEQFKRFLDSGGYQDEQYWVHPFVDGDDTLAFQDAIVRFQDQTGRLGPAGWELGDIPEGENNLPVTGVSWYEAAAYARFEGKDLPTIFHWTLLSGSHASPEVVKFGNFNGKNPEPAKTYPSLTRFGTYDLPGNVSEWIFNNSYINEHFVMGGNFEEPTYFYNSPFVHASTWTRSRLIGFRCILKDSTKSNPSLAQDFSISKRDYGNLNPVKDEIFQIFQELNEFESVALNPKVVSETLEETYKKVIVQLNVPYEQKPLPVYLFIPQKYSPPYQSVIYFPGLDSHFSDQQSYIEFDDRIDFLVKGGRLVIWPVYYASNGRGTINITNLVQWKQAYRYMISDVKTTIDYLETRSDLFLNKIAFYGASWGGAIAPYILASEDRISLGIVKNFGVSSMAKYRFKEFDQVDFLPRVEIPMLMLGGRYDFDYVMEQQQAFYDLLGTPLNDKK
jgi:class 3 adenylate cyclase/dienelactone hydrolase